MNLGRRVLIKIDGGPGRLDYDDMLIELNALGAYLYLTIPNTTHVSQETDRNYGPFKTFLRKNLQILTAQLKRDYQNSTDPNKKSLILNRSHYPILLSGRPADPENGVEALEPAFARAFSRENNLRAWEQCGAVPLTRVLLHHPQVRVDVDVGAKNDLKTMNVSNSAAANKLIEKGYNGNVFLKKVKQNPEPVVQAKVTSQDEKIEALAKEGVNIRNIHVLIGTGCPQAEEVLRAREFAARNEKFVKDQKNADALALLKQNEVKAKEYLEKNIFNSSSYPTLIKWKVGPEEFKRKKSVR